MRLRAGSRLDARSGFCFNRRIVSLAADVPAPRPASAARARWFRYLLLYPALAGALLAPIWNAEGWPFSHEGPAFAQRTLVYMRHWSWGDLLPIWSSADASGFGSPMPALYHKLFYLLAAPLVMLTGSFDAGLSLAIGLLLVVGAIGLDRLVASRGASPLACAVAGASLMAANYTVANWLVRGAMAELSGAMLVPWLLLAYLRALDSGRASVGLGVALALTWLSHSVLAYFAVLLLAGTYLMLALFGRAPWSVLHPASLWKPVAVALTLMLPHALAMWALGGPYDLTRFLTAPLNPSHQFRPLHWYFWDRHWQFGHTVSGLPLQLDLAMLALAAVAAIAWAVRRASARGPLPAVAPLGVVAALCLVLQMSWTEPFYLHVPGAVFIQFPWRLLALLVPALIAWAVVMADRHLAGDRRVAVLVGAGAWMVAGSGAFVPLVDPRLSLDTVSLARVTFSGFREYEPVGAPPAPESLERIAQRWAAAGCTYVREQPDEEVRVVRLSTSCARQTMLPLPLYASPLHVVGTDGERRQAACFELDGAPRLCSAVVPAGQAVVTVTLPTLAGVPGAAVRRVVAVLRGH